jgi:hypothetical protein
MLAKDGKRKLVREGEPSQKTKTGLEIPVPTRDEFFGLLDKAASRPEKPSRSSKGRRRTSRAR